MNILTFDETVLRSSDAVPLLVKVVRESGDRFVVMPAMPGIPQALLEAAETAQAGGDWLTRWHSISERHLSFSHALLHGAFLENAEPGIRALLDELRSVLYGISLVRDLSGRTRDLVATFGPRLSAKIIANALVQAGMPAKEVDGCHIIVTDEHYGSAHWFHTETRAKISSLFSADGGSASVFVVAGSLAASKEGNVTTLGRGGNELTASILAVCLGAEEIHIWSDVDGIMTADPAAVPDAFVIPEISFTEALEMSHFGAHMLYPAAMVPAMEWGISIRIRNLFNTNATGTRILPRAKPSPYPVRGIASIPSVSLLLLQGPGLPGVTGIAARMFEALARVKVNVILITQGSSELSICVAVLPGDAVRGAKALQDEFAQEIDAGTIANPAIEEGSVSYTHL
ncbi:MAG: aspartate kinase, partial [Rectinema sp.]|nr:aspartate kinase [Rectinema sp.]